MPIDTNLRIAGEGLNREYTVLTELRGRSTHLTRIRPTLVETFGPGRWPPQSSLDPESPWFAVGQFEPGGPTLVGATVCRKEVFACCAPTFFTVDAWAACDLRIDAPGKVVEFFRAFESALDSGGASPRKDILVGPPGERVPLKAEYGPAPWAGEGCLVVSARGEPDWTTNRVPLGDAVIVETVRFLCPEAFLVPLGRHAAGDWGESTLLDPIDNDAALRLGGELRSYYVLPGIGDSWVFVTTDSDRSETRVSILG